MQGPKYERVNLEGLVVEISSLLAESNFGQWEESMNENPVGKSVDAVMNKLGSQALGLDDTLVRRIVAMAVLSNGGIDSALPGVVPFILKMLENKEVTVRSIHNDLPFIKVADVSANLSDWYISKDDADKIKNRILPERLKARIAEKTKNGRYTLADAYYLLEDDDNYNPTKIKSELKAAALDGTLPVYLPGKTTRYLYSSNPSIVRDFCEEANWSDLNKWLEDKLPLTHFRFPNPKELPDDAAAQKKCPSKISWQIALFEALSEIQRTTGQEADAKQAIAWLKKNDRSGYISGKDPGAGLCWVPTRGLEKEVSYKTVENVISEWRTQGLLGGFNH